MATFTYQSRQFRALVQRKIRGWKSSRLRAIEKATAADPGPDKDYGFWGGIEDKEEWTKIDAELTGILEKIKAHPDGQDFLNATIGDLIRGYGERTSRLVSAQSYKDLVPFSMGIRIILEQLWKDWFEHGRRRK